LNAKDVIAVSRYPRNQSIRELIRNPFFVHEEDKIKKVLNSMLKNKVHIAIALDEFGGTAGMVTMEDIIEEIIGEIQDEYDDEKPIVEKTSDNTFIINTLAPIDDVNEHLPVPLPSSDDYETLGGLIMSFEGRIPEKNEVIQLEDYSCTILIRSERKLEKVMLKFLNKSDITADS
jgi:CBS domain containing-hemolysin-like protein